MNSPIQILVALQKHVWMELLVVDTIPSVLRSTPATPHKEALYWSISLPRLDAFVEYGDLVDLFGTLTAREVEKSIDDVCFGVLLRRERPYLINIWGNPLGYGIYLTHANTYIHSPITRGTPWVTTPLWSLRSTTKPGWK